MLLKCFGFSHSKDTSASNGQYPTVIEEFSLADRRKSTVNFDENRIIGSGRSGVCLKFGKKLLKCFGFCHSKDTSASKGPYPTVIEEFSLAYLRKATDNFDGNRIIGFGRSGTVYNCSLQHNTANDFKVALKKMHANTGQRYEEFKKEIELLRQLHHPNLVSLIGFCDHKDAKIIVTEYMPNGSLYDNLHRWGKESLSWKKRLEICIGVARAVHCLHAVAKPTIIHRDIRLQNILLDSNMVPKLSDFGLSLQGPEPIQVDSKRACHVYDAPEYVNHGTLTNKCDVYSFGKVLLEIVSGTAIYCIRWSNPVEENIDPDLKGHIAPECWEVFMDITERCLKDEPDERPTMGEVEVQLERALSLQDEEDIKTSNGNYTLLSNTIIKLGPIF